MARMRSREEGVDETRWRLGDGGFRLCLAGGPMARRVMIPPRMRCREVPVFLPEPFLGPNHSILQN